MNCVIEWTDGKFDAVNIKVGGKMIAEIDALYIADSQKILTEMQTIVVDGALTIGSCFDETGL